MWQQPTNRSPPYRSTKPSMAYRFGMPLAGGTHQGGHRLPPPDRGSSSVALSGGSAAPRCVSLPSLPIKLTTANVDKP
jgi:hypothetical protein